MTRIVISLVCGPQTKVYKYICVYVSFYYDPKDQLAMGQWIDGPIHHKLFYNILPFSNVLKN